MGALIPVRSVMRASSLFVLFLILLGFAPVAAADGAPPVGGFDWTGWVSQGGVAVSAPECVSAADKRIDCFTRGQDGQLWRRAFDGSSWKAWAKFGGVANASLYSARPECVASAGAQIDCFVRRHGDGAMFRRTWHGDYVHSWENLGGTLASDPDCVTQKAGRIDCFARGEDGALWHDSFDGDAWSGWVSRGGDIAEGTKPACALRSAGNIECLVVWDDKRLRHMSVGSDDWDEVGEVTAALPSTENLLPSPKCYGAPDDARVDCFMPVADDGRRALMYLRYDGSWTLDDLSSDFGREAAGPDRELAQYDFDCVVRTDARFDCMELASWRGYKGAAAEDGKAVRFRHYAYALGGPPAQWRNVPLTVPVQTGNVSFLKCLSVDGARMDCFTGGSWLGNSTLNQASFVYQERIVFKPMKPVR